MLREETKIFRAGLFLHRAEMKPTFPVRELPVFEIVLLTVLGFPSKTIRLDFNFEWDNGDALERLARNLRESQPAQLQFSIRFCIITRPRTRPFVVILSI